MNLLTSLTGQLSDSGLAILMSALAGVAAALAVAITLAVYVRTGMRSWRDVLKHGIGMLAAVGLFAFVVYDMHHAALAYLGLNSSKPAVEFEIRLPTGTLAATSDTQIELHTDRNQKLAKFLGEADLADGRSLLKGTVALDHRTADRMLVVKLPGRGIFEFRLRLPADPSHTRQFSPWHLADRIAPTPAIASAPQDAFSIRYRVL